MSGIWRLVLVGLLIYMPVDALAQDGHEVVVTQRSGIIDILQIAEGVESQETNPARAANLVFTKLEGKISKNFNGWLRFSITNGDLRDSVFVVQDRADNNLLFSALGQSESRTIPNCFRRAFCCSSSAK